MRHRGTAYQNLTCRRHCSEIAKQCGDGHVVQERGPDGCDHEVGRTVFAAHLEFTDEVHERCGVGAFEGGLARLQICLHAIRLWLVEFREEPERCLDGIRKTDLVSIRAGSNVCGAQHVAVRPPVPVAVLGNLVSKLHGILVVVPSAEGSAKPTAPWALVQCQELKKHGGGPTDGGQSIECGSAVSGGGGNGERPDHRGHLCDAVAHRDHDGHLLVKRQLHCWCISTNKQISLEPCFGGHVRDKCHLEKWKTAGAF